ncbi:hypothetical protein PFICI_05003 [Pestalotiopsis fici W106-1]|uniref:Uncharacterized protein n=1 Tax=Pestalotiopsis fici (strain W106-1 / CGMCC3.15140) TaxID=1229662 RepID=W3XCF2_PESFW|nr:uncharacterized protein PFICI_05003 [Pestalotiopsis fici W106-1]ETS83127.1 hypothetical protein PFICI_05003 [Pestalotiopsis fici W106-1]
MRSTAIGGGPMRKYPTMNVAALPAPSLSSYNPFSRSDASPYGAPSQGAGGIRGWFSKLKNGNKRSAAGAYEQPTAGTGGRAHRGFGALDPDEAWDTRVGTEADAYGGYYEEQELGDRHGGNPYGHDPYGGSGYPMNLAATPGHAPEPYGGHDEPRGRSRERDPELGVPASGPAGGSRTRQNPFDDNQAEPSNISLRGVSPRPMANDDGKAENPFNDSPTAERRSIFRENV